MIETASGEIVVPYAMRDHVREAIEKPDEEPEFDGVYGIDLLMITEQTARRLGFDIVEFGAIVRNDAPLTQTQLDAVSRTFEGTALGGVVPRRRRHDRPSFRVVGVRRG